MARIARGCLPANTALQKDALLALTKSATVFISLLASEANNLTDKKTIQPADVSAALGECEHGYARARVMGETQLWEQEVRVKRRGWRDNQIAREKEREKDKEGKQGEEEDEDEDEEAGDSMHIDGQSEHSTASHPPIKIKLTNGAKISSHSKPTGGAEAEAADEESDDDDENGDDEEEDADEDQKDDEEELENADTAEGEAAEGGRERDDPRQRKGQVRKLMAPGGAVDLDDEDESSSDHDSGRNE